MIDNVKNFLNLTKEDLKEPVILKLKDNTFYLLFNTKANTFTKSFMRTIHKKLDIVEKHEGPTALVTLSLSKIFSAGLNLKEMEKGHDEDRRYMIDELSHLLGRITGLCVPTICLVRGAAVAGGCILSLSFDELYVAGKALLWANQTAIQLCAPPGVCRIVEKRHTYPSALRDMLLFSQKFDEKRCLENKVIDGIWSEEQALAKVHQRAESIADLGFNKENMKKIKYQLHKQAISDSFNRPSPYSIVGYSPFKDMPKL